MNITRKSVLTGKVNSIELPVTAEQVAAWQAGALIQDVMPHLNTNQREFLISGSTPEEWAAAFPEEE